MPGYVKADEVWEEASPYVKVDGVWKFSPEAWEKVSGEWKQFFLASGFNDSSFATYDIISNSSGLVNDIAVQSDGKIILAGEFITFNGTTVNRIVRLNSDGTPDTAFTTNTGTGASAAVSSIAIQSDGKIVISGAFTAFNGTTATRIARLNSDGTLDTTFVTNTGTGLSGGATSIAIQSDGKIVLGGNFTTLNSATVNRIARLNSDGTPDTAFTTNTSAGASAGIFKIAIQSDGKIVLVGDFSTFNSITARRVARLNSDGTRDAAFITNVNNGASGIVYSAVIQSDEKIVVAGQFTSFNGATVGNIVRLNSDGTRDTTFTTNTGVGFENPALSLALQSDGKIVVGGNFFNFNTRNGVNRIARLNSDGTIDTSFSMVKGLVTNATAPATVSAVAIQSDGKIVLGGIFISFGGTTANRIVRLNSDGTFDTTFATNIGTGANGSVTELAIQSDGKIVVGGSFTTFNGVTVNYIARLNSDGTPDTAFTTNTGTGASALVAGLAIQSDGKIVVGGSFLTFNGAITNRITRLNSDGTPDTAFDDNVSTIGTDGTVSAIAIQSDGKILIGGAFTTFDVTTVNRIARLNSDGSLDTTFDTNTGTGADGTVSAIAIQSDGKIVLGGLFTTFNGTTVNRIVRLNSDGTPDTAFTTSTGTGASSTVSAIAIQSDAKIVLGGAFTTFNGTTVNRIVRLNSDGSLDTTFVTNTGVGASSFINAVAIQSDGKIVLGGFFTSFNNTIRTAIARIGGDLSF